MDFLSYKLDDWMGSVEMSIAMALKKKGIEPPPMPKLEPKDPVVVEPPATGKNRNKKQRRRDQERKELKKVCLYLNCIYTPYIYSSFSPQIENQSSRSDSRWPASWRSGSSSSDTRYR